MGLIKRVDRYVLMGILVCLPFVLALAVLGFVAELLGTLSGPLVTWIVSDSLAEHHADSSLQSHQQRFSTQPC